MTDKEKVLLDKINELYKKVKGEFIKEELLCSGNFLEILKEIYKMPNGVFLTKEKVVKNGGKNAVLIIAVTKENEYIITFQTRIKDKIIAEFPAGYVEKDETPLEAARRELLEETGYSSNNFFILDEAYTSPGIDNSTTYIIVANDCVKAETEGKDGHEIISWGLFKDNELDYLIDNNIMNGAMNKLAYYNFINKPRREKGNIKQLRLN